MLQDRSSSISRDLERCSLQAGTEENSRSSSHYKATVERLEKENAQLKTQYEELRCQYVQLLEEAREERFEERRVNLLKAQVMQLERQVILLSEGLSSQLCRSQDVEKALDPLTQRLRSLLDSSAGADVVISQSELTQLVESCEDMKQKLRRNNKVTSVESLAVPWLLSGSALTKQPTTLLDLCYGKTNNLNLQHVSALESRLSELFKHLQGIRQTLCLILAPAREPCSGLDSSSERGLVPPAPAGLYSHLLNQASLCCLHLNPCCMDLLTLSLISPSALWAGSEQRVISELEVENILATLPVFPQRASLQQTTHSTQTISPAAYYSLLMTQQQVEALETELEFHRSLYSLQVRTIEELVQGIRQAYRSFQENIFHSLCVPLQDVLSCYEDLRGSASEAALRRFLSAFKSSSAQIREAVEALDPSKSQGDEALAQYGCDFLQAVENLLKDCAEKREKSASQIPSLQRERQQALHTLNTLRVQQKVQHRGQHRVQHRVQTPPAGPGSSQQACPEALDQAESSGDPSSQALDKQPSLLPAQQRPRAQRKALTEDVTSHTSRHGPAQPAEVSQRPRRRRSSPRGKCSNLPARPEWQS